MPRLGVSSDEIAWVASFTSTAGLGDGPAFFQPTFSIVDEASQDSFLAAEPPRQLMTPARSIPIESFLPVFR